MAWQPNPAGLQQIVGLLSDFQQPGADQHRVLAQLSEFRANPEFNNYLAHIFAAGDGLPLEVRQSAGLLLKNNLRSAPATSPASLRASILAGLRLPDRPLRHTAGTCAVTAVVAGAGGPWPELPAALADALDSGDAAAVEGALDTVYKLYEEAPTALEGEIPPGSNTRPSDALLPRVLAQFSHPDPATRAVAISAVNLAANYMPVALQTGIDTYIQGLFASAQHDSPAVRKAVCAGLVQLTTLAGEKLEPHLAGVIEYMLASTQDEDEGVAVEACEFWSAFPDSGLEVAALRGYLPRIIPVLLKNMVYDEYDEEVADAEADEEAALSGRAAARDRDADVNPHVRTAAAHGNEDDDEDDEEGEVARWNLRRCSAAGLDMLSNAFGDDLLPLLLPAVQARLGEGDWRAREGAMLALGAVSDGCFGGLKQHLPGIILALLPGLKDARPMVRVISCWALTRYSRGLLDRAAAGDRSMLDAVIAGVTEATADRNRRVQEAACGSVATFVEEAGEAAGPYLGQLLGALGGALAHYGRRSLRNAYDAVCTVADRLPAAFAAPEGAALVLPPLFAKLTTIPDGDRDVLPLLECVAAVAPAAGAQLQPYAEAAFARCVAIADACSAAAASGAADPEEAAEFIVCALDGASGLVEGLGAGVESLVARSALPDVLVRCARDASPDIRQSAFALIGDLSAACIPHLKPVLGDLIAAALANLEPAAFTPDAASACNNAAWALGQLAIACTPEEAGSFALPTLERLLRVLTAPGGSLPRSLVENCAIAVGRLAWVRPDLMAPHGPAYVAPLCASLRNIRDGIEKEHAFRGLAAVLAANPGAASGQAFTALCEAVVSWRDLGSRETLRGELTGVMMGYKGQLEAMGQWQAALGTLSPPAAAKLIEMLGLQ